ncbi:hypothetical protein LZ198_29920 [Myxococcus sp. K15C18031901]|uniref:hypothetical protein n=1 Tax=Myxococcus dinghuensis TaxID=2906761 RepID=UPI0020A7369C|nr:hypothetical protein [Myxococcus dinghuensis]MCP3103104.1 hypothetical protein [Myxococcus dinghuensis]
MAREHGLEWSHGVQRAWFEAPDILWARFRGAINEDTSRWSCAIYREVASRGRFYLAADIADSHLSAESRRYVVANTKADWFRGIIYIGAGVEQRVTTKSLMVGTMLGGTQRLDMTYADTLEEARAWVEAHRAGSAGR